MEVVVKVVAVQAAYVALVALLLFERSRVHHCHHPRAYRTHAPPGKHAPPYFLPFKKPRIPWGQNRFIFNDQKLAVSNVLFAVRLPLVADLITRNLLPRGGSG